jgi:hypothetical protein
VRAQRVAGATAAVGLIRCSHTLDPTLNGARCGSASVAPTGLQFPSDIFVARGNQPVHIPAGQATATAVARLQLPTIGAGIGQSPDPNRWNMAEVECPWWLWADGSTHVGPAFIWQPSLAGQSPAPVPGTRAGALRNEVLHPEAVQIPNCSRHVLCHWHRGMTRRSTKGGHGHGVSS